jgi:hypothetical protein
VISDRDYGVLNDIFGPLKSSSFVILVLVMELERVECGDASPVSQASAILSILGRVKLGNLCGAGSFVHHLHLAA